MKLHLNRVTNDTKTFTEMQTGLQLHLLKSYSNLQKRLLLYSLYILRDQIQIVTEKMHSEMHFPLSHVKILLHYNLDRSTTSFLYKGKALKTQLHILLHFCPSQLPSSCKNKYTFSQK